MVRAWESDCSKSLDCPLPLPPLRPLPLPEPVSPPWVPTLGQDGHEVSGFFHSCFLLAFLSFLGLLPGPSVTLGSSWHLSWWWLLLTGKVYLIFQAESTVCPTQWDHLHSLGKVSRAEVAWSSVINTISTNKTLLASCRATSSPHLLGSDIFHLNI